MSDEKRPKIVWKMESTHPELVEPLREALRAVVDPEIGMSVIDLGLVRDVQVGDDFASINMILTTPFCPYGPAMLEMTRSRAEQALGRPTRIEMGMEMWDFTMMEEGSGANWGMY